MGNQSSERPKDYVKNQRDFNTLHSNGKIESFEERALKLSLLLFSIWQRPVQSFLDVGCRTGYVIDDILNRYPSARVVGVDIVPEFVELAKDTDCEACIADMHDLPFEDREFEWVLCSQTLEHCHDVARGVRELQRVAEKGLIISVPLEQRKWYEDNKSHYARSPDSFTWLDLFDRENWHLLFAAKTGQSGGMALDGLMFEFILIREGVYEADLRRF